MLHRLDHPALAIEDHAVFCGCWMCSDREPDTSSRYYDDMVMFGGCAYCNDPLGHSDSGPVHEECSPAFLRFIQES